MENLGCFMAFDYFIAIILLIYLHASWWMWLIFIVGSLFWIFVWLIFYGGGGSSSDNPKQDKP